MTIGFWNSSIQDQGSKPEDDGCGDADGAHEPVGAAVAAGCDGSPALQPSEQAFDDVVLFPRMLATSDLMAMLPGGVI
jgi:hypothetical protein